MGKKYNQTIEFYRRKTLRRERHKLRRKNKKYNPFKSYQKKGKTKPTPALECALLHKANKNKFGLKNKKRTIIIPRIFCIIKNPNETMRILKKINELLLRKRDIILTIDISNCEELGIGAITLLKFIIKYGTNYLKENGCSILLRGNYPKNKEAFLIFSYSGLPQLIGVRLPKVDGLEILDPFKTIQNTNDEVFRIVGYYNRCLRKCGLTLSEDGKVYIAHLVNEVVDNGIIHHGKHGSFYVAGHYNDEEKKGKLSIISFGKTIYENLSSSTTSLDIKNALKKQEKYHNKFYNLTFDKEVSWTIFGLQFGISSVKDEEDIDRGTGTYKFIDGFMKLGQTNDSQKPLMSIYSGNTHILFDGTYYLKKVPNKKKAIIAFNKSNDLKKIPDVHYVKRLAEKFPGVIISIEFFVDRNYLEQFKEDSKNEK